MSSAVGSNESAKLAAQTQQAVNVQQMQSAVQMLNQGFTRHKTMGLQPNQVQAQAQAAWPNPTVKQHPGMSKNLDFFSCFFSSAQYVSIRIRLFGSITAQLSTNTICGF